VGSRVVGLFIGIAEKVPGPIGSWCSTTTCNSYSTRHKTRVEGVLGQIIIIPVQHCMESEMNITGRPGGTASEVNQQTNGRIAKMERCMGAGDRLVQETMFLGRKKTWESKNEGCDNARDHLSMGWG
jgi:hypothetical protein